MLVNGCHSPALLRVFVCFSDKGSRTRKYQGRQCPLRSWCQLLSFRYPFPYSFHPFRAFFHLCQKKGEAFHRSPIAGSRILKQEYAAAPDVHIIDSSKMSRHTETARSAAAPDTVEIPTPFPIICTKLNTQRNTAFS